MKQTFVILLFVNVVFFLWAQNADQGRTIGRTPKLERLEASGLETIVLVGEPGSEALLESASGRTPPLDNPVAGEAPALVSEISVSTQPLGEEDTLNLAPRGEVEENIAPTAEPPKADFPQDYRASLPSSEADDIFERDSKRPPVMKTPQDQSEPADQPKQQGDDSPTYPANREGATQSQKRSQISVPLLADKDPVAAPECYEIGPFGKAAAAKSTVKSIDAAGGKAKSRSKTVDEHDGYLVVYPAADTFEQSMGNIQMLKQHGVEDVWLLGEGELRGAISLGFFETRQRAVILQNKFAEQDIITQVKPRVQKKQQYWVDALWARRRGDLKLNLAKAGLPVDVLEFNRIAGCAAEHFAQ